jgi:hypothetical protein
MSPVDNLIDLVQSAVSPRDGIPRPPSGSNNDLGDHRLPEVPPWLSDREAGSEIVDLGDGEEIGIADDPDMDPSTAAPVVANPDVYAYYLPFHFYRKRWGIYVRASGVADITRSLSGVTRLTGTPGETALARCVLEMLILHETFHHLTELAISRFEAVGYESGASGPVPYECNFFAAQASLIEEGLANAYALRSLEQYVAPLKYSMRTGALALISGFMEKEPPGYRDLEAFLPDSDFARGQDTLIEEVKKTLRLPQPLSAPDGLLAGRKHFVERTLPRRCQVRLVVEPRSAVRVARPFPKHNGMQVFVHMSREHKPAHFHLFMPPGRPYGRIQWPSLLPYPGDPAISRKDAERLKEYVSSLEPSISQKIAAVFPESDDHG